MILCFMAESNDDLIKHLDSMKGNATESKVSSLFGKVEYSFFRLKTSPLVLIIVYINFILPNILPNRFFWWAFKKGLRKKTGYKEELKYLKHEEALIEIVEGSSWISNKSLIY